MLLFQSLFAGVNEFILLGLVLFGLLLANPVLFLCLAVFVLAIGLGLFRPMSCRAAAVGQRAQENDLRVPPFHRFCSKCHTRHKNNGFGRALYPLQSTCFQ